MKRIIFLLLILISISGCGKTSNKEKDPFVLDIPLENISATKEVNLEDVDNLDNLIAFKAEEDEDEKYNCRELDGSKCVNKSTSRRLLIQNTTTNLYINLLPIIAYQGQIDQETKDNVTTTFVDIAPGEIVAIPLRVEYKYAIDLKTINDLMTEEQRQNLVTKDPIKMYQKDLTVENIVNDLNTDTLKASVTLTNNSNFESKIISYKETELNNHSYAYQNWPSWLSIQHQLVAPKIPYEVAQIDVYESLPRFTKGLGSLTPHVPLPVEFRYCNDNLKLINENTSTTPEVQASELELYGYDENDRVSKPPYYIVINRQVS